MTNIARWDPFSEAMDLRNAMDNLFDRGFVRPWRLLNWEGAEGLFPVDLYETEDEVVVKASLPGAKPEDVSISITGGTLTIKGEVKHEEEERKAEYYRRERRSGTFQRAFTLPVRVESDKAAASFEDGVLHLHLPKAAEMRPKTIEVKAKGVLEGNKS